METRKYLAELIGTFILVALGSLSILATGATGGPILVIVPLGFGLALLAAIVVTGHVSGGHYNPAVTLGALVDRRIGRTDAAIYVVAQVVGALAASALILVLRDRQAVEATTNGLGPSIGAGGGFVIEVLLTAVFVAVILTITRRSPGQAVFVIPLTLLVIHVVGIPFSGASVNPARSLGPALVSGHLADLWIYLTAPFVGAVLGWLVVRLLGEDDAELAQP